MRIRRFRRIKNKYMRMMILCVTVVFIGFFFLKGCKAYVDENLLNKVARSTVRLVFAGDSEDEEYSLAGMLVSNICPSYKLSNEETKKLHVIMTAKENTEAVENQADGNDTEDLESGASDPVEASTEPVDDNDESQGIMETAGKIYPMEKLLNYDYVKNNFYVVPNDTELPASILDLDKITCTDITIKKDKSVPQVLIFHTHSQERFADSDSNGKSIVDVGDRLTELLEKEYGYNVIHLKDTFDLVDGKLDRGTAYTLANAKVDEVLAENPSIQVVIDLHRDGIDESRHLVTEIDGKKTAKIMLFNGISYLKGQGEVKELYNPYLTENMTMTYKMYILSKAWYPDFVRCIYIAGYRYCLHHAARSMLIEAGAQTNTFEEVYNSMEPLAKMLDKILSVP